MAYRFSLILFIYLFTCIFHSTFAQSQIRQENGVLNWKTRMEFDSISGSNKKIMYFEDGQLKGNFPISYLNDLIGVNSNTNKISFRFKYTKFETISAEELPDSGSLSDIKDTVIIESSIQTERKVSKLLYSFLPVRKNKISGEYERLSSYILEIRIDTVSDTKLATAKSTTKSTTIASSSVLSSGDWYKMTVTSSGVYRITYDELKDLGLSDPSKVKIFGNGGSMLNEVYDGTDPNDLNEIPISVVTGSDGTFNSGDYILFYAQGPVVWKWSSSENWYSYTKHYFTDAITYFITSGESGKRISTSVVPSGTVTNEVTTYDFYDCHEENTTNLIGSGQEMYGESFDAETTSATLSFDLTNLVSTEKVKLKANAVASASATTIYTYTYNGTTIGTSSIAAASGYDYGYSGTVSSSFTANEGTASIKVNYNVNGASSAKGWLNYLKIWCRKNLAMESGQLKFSDINSVDSGYISRYNIANAGSNIWVWDVTNLWGVSQKSTSLSGSTLSFVATSDTLKYYIAFDYTSGYLTPTISKTKIDNQNLHLNTGVNYIIVTHPDFEAQAEELAQLREANDSLTVLVVTPEQIYNEFSSGNPDPAAIRNFAKMVYDRSVSGDNALKYLLLFGDGSYDRKSTSSSNTNYVLTYQSVNSLNYIYSYCSDDYFGLLDKGEAMGSGLMDIGVGRFPVSDTDEANAIINKLKSYVKSSMYGSWRNILSFVADDYDADGDIFMYDSDKITETLKSSYPNFNIEKIYLDAFQQVSGSSGESYPDVNTAIYNRINQGGLIMNYMGHSNERCWSSELILQQSDINSWTNSIYPLMFTASCEFGRFDDYDYQSGAENALMNANGGVISIISATREVIHSNNNRLNKYFFQKIFSQDSNSKKISVGEALRLAKNLTGTEINKCSFVLLGDPALVLPYTLNQVSTDSVNGKVVTGSDTVKALEEVTIAGSIKTSTGTDYSTFNGTIYPVVYDKSETYTTLANDIGSAFSFNSQKNILFSGQASVVNGKFSFSFILPKDIDYSYGAGKMSYYAKTSSNEDASGYSNDIIIGGINSTDVTDDRGPVINLYINDSTFRDGGITDKYPAMYIKLQDSSGINSSGTAIGHDLVATLDGDLSSQYILNSYYQSNLDDYKKGEIYYQLPEMSAGTHTILFKAWDLLNNSSTAQITFNVLGEQNPVIQNLYCYPNPTSGETKFYFEHNKSGESLDIEIDIYNMTGLPVCKLTTTIESEGYTSGELEWDGKSSSGKALPCGIYLYRATIICSDGTTTSGAKKLMIIK
jgi:hypothetical protein